MPLDKELHPRQTSAPLPAAERGPFAACAARQTFSRLPSRCHKLRRERHESPVTLFRCGAPRFHLLSRVGSGTQLCQTCPNGTPASSAVLWSALAAKDGKMTPVASCCKYPPRPHPTPPHHRPHSHTHTHAHPPREQKNKAAAPPPPSRPHLEPRQHILGRAFSEK